MTKSKILKAGKSIGLALSGGGIRAAVFHLGALRYLAERDLLDRVAYISTVSGGSLLGVLVFKCNGYKWPSSVEFLTNTHAKIRNIILSRDLQCRAIARLLFLPWNWFRIPFRTNILADTIHGAWEIRETFSTLTEEPVWAINATAMESGKRWKFKKVSGKRNSITAEMGDYVLGFTDASNFKLSKAVATSAAFPGGISPLLLCTLGRKWWVYRQKGDVRKAVPFKPRYWFYHLADGGVYDNLGLEPLFDLSRNTIRPETGCDYLIVSDAGAPLTEKRWGWLAQVLGFSERTIDIMHTQSRDLRIRALAGAIAERKSCRGLIVRISESASDAVMRAKESPDERIVQRALAIQRGDFLSGREVAMVANYATDLHAPIEEWFKKLEQHGYEATKIQMELYG